MGAAGGKKREMGCRSEWEKKFGCFLGYRRREGEGERREREGCPSEKEEKEEVKER